MNVNTFIINNILPNINSYLAYSAINNLINMRNYYK